MHPRRRRPEVLIVGDTAAFGRVISAIMDSEDLDRPIIRHTTYDSFQGMLIPRVLRETNLFVLELWRTYSTGLRAEGLAVAEELIRQRSLPLVVSPLAFADTLDLAWYWDMAARDSLAARCKRLLRNGFMQDPAASAALLVLKDRLRGYLDKQSGHEDEALGSKPSGPDDDHRA